MSAANPAANCPYCSWTDSSGPELDEVLALGARLQDHLVVEHCWAFGEATDAASRWFNHLLLPSRPDESEAPAASSRRSNRC